jgi:hypothetical protein
MKVRTICEVLREINDMHQTNSEHDIRVRNKLVEAENMAKRMDKKLLSYNKKYSQKWWAANPDYEKDLKKRMNKKYCIGGKLPEKEKK